MIPEPPEGKGGGGVGVGEATLGQWPGAGPGSWKKESHLYTPLYLQIAICRDAKIDVTQSQWLVAGAKICGPTRVNFIFRASSVFHPDLSGLPCWAQADV